MKVLIDSLLSFSGAAKKTNRSRRKEVFSELFYYETSCLTIRISLSRTSKILITDVFNGKNHCKRSDDLTLLMIQWRSQRPFMNGTKSPHESHPNRTSEKPSKTSAYASYDWAYPHPHLSMATPSKKEILCQGELTSVFSKP